MDFQKVIDQLPALLTHWGVRVVGVFVLLFVAWIVSGWARRTVVKVVEKKGIDKSVGLFFGSLLRWGILLAAGIACLGVFGFETTSFAAVLGAAGLAVGLAFQGTLSNFASGVMLLVFRPFKIGDVVKVAGQIGVVKEIDLFTTEMTTFDNRRIIVPNTKIFGDIIENITYYDIRRVDVSVGTAYSAGIEPTRTVLESALRKVPKVVDEPAERQVFLSELQDSSVSWTLRMWAKGEDYWNVHQDALRIVKADLEQAGISIPFPQVEVHMASAPKIGG
jgi:small conductance mechanosensitive channel